MNAKMRTLKVVVALTESAFDARADLSEVMQGLNQAAAMESRGVRFEITNWCEEGVYPHFYRESPGPLVEQIRRDYQPDVIVGIFRKRFGTTAFSSTLDVEQELVRADEKWKSPDHPRVLLYICAAKSSAGNSEEERIEQEYVARFRGFFQPDTFWWFYKKRSQFRSRSHESELRALVYKHLWRFSHQPLMGGAVSIAPPIPELKLPHGWQHITPQYLGGYRNRIEDGNKLSTEAAIDYFNGRAPNNWKVAVSASVPRREVAERLVEEIGKVAHAEGPMVTLLMGPGGEGKSTILRQVAVDLAENHPGIHVIWQEVSATPMDGALIRQLLKEPGHFILIIDNAEWVAPDVYDGIRFICAQPRSNIQFLLASRGTDWQWMQGSSYDKWVRELGAKNFVRLSIKRLELKDARRIVKAWEDAGPGGLGDLAKVPEGQRAQHLVNLALEEEDKNKRDTKNNNEEGSFFGAILWARKSKTLESYVEDILNRLKTHSAPGGGTLQDVFAHIVALHADGLQILSKPILRHLLACSWEGLEDEVIKPLADEAATDADGWLVLARHRAVAEIAKKILEAQYPGRLERQIYPDLLRAAIRKLKTEDGELKKFHMKPWNNLARFYGGLKRVNLALRLAETAAELERDDPYPVVAWAHILRDFRKRKEAVDVFQQRYDLVRAKRNKAYFYEWAAAQGQINNHCLDAWLCGISLSDWATADEWHPKYAPPMMLLSGLTSALSKLHIKASDPNNIKFYNVDDARLFLRGCAAAAQLGLDARAQKEMPPGYDRNKSERYLNEGRRIGLDNGVPNVEPAEAISLFRDAIIRAWELRDKDNAILPESLPSADALTFRKLSAQLGIKAESDVSPPRTPGKLSPMQY